jgi:imidazolonepropionase-like amidohydrolase
MHDLETGRAARLVDTHVHIRETIGLETVLAAGVCAVRDAGTKNAAGLGLLWRGGQRGAVAVRSAGWALYKKGGYGSSFGTPVEDRDAFPREVRRLKAAGADIIKVVASGMVSLKMRDTITAGGFDKEELVALVQAARSEGLEVMAHANGEQAIIASAEAGVRSVEHGFFMTTKALDTLARQGTFWTPTVGALARAALAAGTSDEMRASIDNLIDSHLAMIRYAHDLGIGLTIGTDCVLPDPRYGEVFDVELAYFVKAGLTHEEVMRIASDNGARLLGLE